MLYKKKVSLTLVYIFEPGMGSGSRLYSAAPGAEAKFRNGSLSNSNGIFTGPSLFPSRILPKRYAHTMFIHTEYKDYSKRSKDCDVRHPGGSGLACLALSVGSGGFNVQSSIGCSLGAHTDQGPLIGQKKKIDLNKNKK